MKYLYLFMGIALLVIIMVLFFQMAVFGEYTFPFFNLLIKNQLRALYIILFSFCAGTFLTLGIRGFLETNDSIDDGFDL